MPAKKKAAFNFEKSLTDLEKIVESMEAGDLTLEQSMQQFEQGMQLAKQCQGALSDAEQKVELLVAENEQAMQTEPFFEEDDEAFEDEDD